MPIKQRLQANVRTVVLLAVAILATVLVASTHTFAAANTLRVSPVRTDIEMKPGTTKAVKTTVTNLTDASVTVRPIENDFIAGDENGTPALILDASKYAPTHSLKRFMTPLGDVTIPAKESRTVDVIITVPKNAQAGGYFGAIRFAPATPDSGGQVNLSASVASIILLTVPGDTVEQLDLTDYDIQQNGHTGWFFHTPDNLQLYTRFENKGNLQEGPFGKVSVTSGKKVVYAVDFNQQEPRDMVLPDSARRWTIPLKKIGTFGHYTVSATFTYGKNNQTIDVSKSFWVVPWWLIIAAGVALLVIIGVIILIITRTRRRRRRISRRLGRR